MEPKRTLHSGNLEEEERFIKKLKLLLSLYWQEESFQILKIEDKEENFSFMETMGKENHNSAGL